MSDRDIQKPQDESSNQPSNESRIDCGFRLNFDCPIVGLSGTFYPPASGNGITCEGYFNISLMYANVYKKEFVGDTISDLAKQGNEYIDGIAAQIKALIDNGTIKL
jgi:hypothetical protein